MIGSTEYTGARLAALVAAGEKVRDLSVRLRLPYVTVSRRIVDHVAKTNPSPRQLVRRNAVPLFPVGSFTPHSTCPHRRPLPESGWFVCMVCHGGATERTTLPNTEPDTRRIRRRKQYGLPSRRPLRIVG
jgi:hypothetical protein